MAMFFFLSKLFWFFARPLNMLFFLALACGLLSRLGFRKLARTGLTIITIVFAVAGFTQFADWAILKLEMATPAGAIPQNPVGIIVLGGGLSANAATPGVDWSLGEASDRLFRGLELKRQYPDARFIYSGGAASFDRDANPETSAALNVVRALYGNSLEMEVESQSLNTWQNASYVRKMLKNDRTGAWLLVTSAFHMPRALGCFRQAGINVTPVPADYRADKLVAPYLTGSSAEQFLKLAIVGKELIGLAVYRMTGRINTLFPQ